MWVCRFGYDESPVAARNSVSPNASPPMKKYLPGDVFYIGKSTPFRIGRNKLTNRTDFIAECHKAVSRQVGELYLKPAEEKPDGNVKKEKTTLEQAKPRLFFKSELKRRLMDGTGKPIGLKEGESMELEENSTIFVTTKVFFRVTFEPMVICVASRLESGSEAELSHLVDALRSETMGAVETGPSIDVATHYLCKQKPNKVTNRMLVALAKCIPIVTKHFLEITIERIKQGLPALNLRVPSQEELMEREKLLQGLSDSMREKVKAKWEKEDKIVKSALPDTQVMQREIQNQGGDTVDSMPNFASQKIHAQLGNVELRVFPPRATLLRGWHVIATDQLSKRYDRAVDLIGADRVTLLNENTEDLEREVQEIVSLDNKGNHSVNAVLLLYSSKGLRSWMTKYKRLDVVNLTKSIFAAETELPISEGDQTSVYQVASDDPLFQDEQLTADHGTSPSPPRPKRQRHDVQQNVQKIVPKTRKKVKVEHAPSLVTVKQEVVVEREVSKPSAAIPDPPKVKQEVVSRHQPRLQEETPEKPKEVASSTSIRVKTEPETRTISRGSKQQVMPQDNTKKNHKHKQKETSQRESKTDRETCNNNHQLKEKKEKEKKKETMTQSVEQQVRTYDVETIVHHVKREPLGTTERQKLLDLLHRPASNRVDKKKSKKKNVEAMEEAPKNRKRFRKNKVIRAKTVGLEPVKWVVYQFDTSKFEEIKKEEEKRIKDEKKDLEAFSSISKVPKKADSVSLQRILELAK